MGGEGKRICLPANQPTKLNQLHFDFAFDLARGKGVRHWAVALRISPSAAVPPSFFFGGEGILGGGGGGETSTSVSKGKTGANGGPGCWLYFDFDFPSFQRICLPASQPTKLLQLHFDFDFPPLEVRDQKPWNFFTNQPSYFSCTSTSTSPPLRSGAKSPGGGGFYQPTNQGTSVALHLRLRLPLGHVMF